MIHTRDGRVAGQWIQPDLWGIYQQMTADQPSPPRPVSAELGLPWSTSAR